MSLYWRVVAINAGGLVLAALALALSPATVSSRMTAAEAAVIAAGTLALIAVNVVLLRRVDFLEHDRRASGRRALMAQESERRRLARELHDEVGQTLTGVVLQLEGLHRLVPAELAEPVAQLQETAREGAEEVREIIRGLRPQALDEFGLRSALVSLAAGVTERAGVRVRARVGTDLPALSAEQELAIYRVAQESLTNVARHAGAESAELSLAGVDGRVILRVRDDGRGIAPDAADGEGVGIGGMRERALLVGGRLTIGRHDAGGTEVRLEVPL